jgi:hypothetical protein
MRKGIQLLACAAVLTAVTAGAPLAAHAAKSGSTRPASATTSATSKKKATMRQYTGYVTAIDKTSITVEKRGKKPETKVFVRQPEMSTVGEVTKDAHVTVYYRDDAGRATAHKVVVKTTAVSAAVGS